jgi:hypothetical protein
MVSELKWPALWKGLDPLLRYMYIVIQCCLSSTVEYVAKNYVVDCVKKKFKWISVSGLHVLWGALHIAKITPDTHHIKYHFCSMRFSFVLTQYVLCTVGDSHYFLLRMFLPYDMIQLYMVAGPLKYTKAL